MSWQLQRKVWFKNHLFSRVNYPIGLIHPTTKENILSTQLLEKDCSIRIISQ